MKPVEKVSVLIAAGISLVVGLRDGSRIPRPEDRELRWTSIFAPLAEAPIPVGGDAALLAAPLPSQESPIEPLYEAVARRPDVSWRLFDGAVSGSGPDFVVLVGEAPPPAGWQSNWCSGRVCVCVRKP